MRQIDADALKEELRNEYEIELENVPFMKNDKRISIDVINEIIDDAPTINEWIPVSKVMPPTEKYVSDIVLVTYRYLDEEDKMAMAYYCIRNLDNPADGEWCTSYGCGLPVIAWMPMPEPYGGDVK